MAGQEFRFRFDATGDLVEIGVGAVLSTTILTAAGCAIGGAVIAMRRVVLVERAVKFVVPIGVVAQRDAAGDRVDVDLFDARNGTEYFANLLEEFGIALAGRNFHADAPRHLMGDLQVHLGFVLFGFGSSPGPSRGLSLGFSLGLSRGFSLGFGHGLVRTVRQELAVLIKFGAGCASRPGA